LEFSILFFLDTIYALQDKKDDAKAGVKSITLILQNKVKIALSFFAAVLVSSWLICGVLTGCGMVYFLVTVVGGGSILSYDLFSIDLDDPKSCLHAVRLKLSATVRILIFLHSLNAMASR
jgi:4-hydroxybenzoate polyprenyltransferase